MCFPGRSQRSGANLNDIVAVSTAWLRCNDGRGLCHDLLRQTTGSPHGPSRQAAVAAALGVRLQEVNTVLARPHVEEPAKHPQSASDGRPISEERSQRRVPWEDTTSGRKPRATARHL